MNLSSYANRIAGFASLNTGVISNCYSDAKVRYKTGAAGFIYENSGKIMTSLAQGHVKGKENLAGFCRINTGELINCGYTRKPKKGQYTDKQLYVGDGKNADIVQKLSLSEAWTYTDDNGRIELTDNKGELLSTRPAGEPIPISSAKELFSLSEQIAGGDKLAAARYYVLTKDINLGGKKWLPIGFSDANPFTGFFDGAGHTVSNFKIVSKGLDYAGFFGYIKGATVCELSLDCVANAADGQITGCMCALNENGVIHACRVVAKLSAEKVCGGFVGKNTGHIQHCAFIGKLTPFIPPIFWLAPIAGLLLALLIAGLAILLLNNKTPYDPLIIDPNQSPVRDTSPVTPPPAGSNRISFEMNQEVYINVDTGVGRINYVNPRRSTQDVVIKVVISDAELLRTIGKTGRSAREQAKLEESPDYNAEQSFTTLFTSGRLQIGYELEAVQLSALEDGTSLPEGDYEMLVIIDAYDPETFEKAVVNARAPITVHMIRSAE